MTLPPFPPESFHAYDIPVARRPGGVTAVCVIAVVLGSMGLLGSLGAIASLAIAPRLQEAFVTSPQVRGNEKFVEAQREFLQTIQAVTNRYWWPQAGLALVNAGLAACMLAGGLKVLNGAASARTFLIAVFAFALLFEISRSVVSTSIQWQMAAVMSDLMPRMMESARPSNVPNAQQAAAMGSTFAKMGVFIGIGFALVVSAVKLAFYFTGWSYLQSAAARDWIESAGPP